MFDNFARPVKEKLLIPFASVIGKYLTPNQISVIGFIVGIASVIFTASGILFVGLFFWILNRILDGLDGTVARVTDNKSDFGGYLDLILDLILYILVPSAFVFNGIVNTEQGIELLWSCLFLFGVFYINLGSWAVLSALIEKGNNKLSNLENKQFTSVVMPAGIVEGTETVVFYTLFFLFPQYLFYLFITMSALTLTGALQRWVWAYRNIK